MKFTPKGDNGKTKNALKLSLEKSQTNLKKVVDNKNSGDKIRDVAKWRSEKQIQK